MGHFPCKPWEGMRKLAQCPTFTYLSCGFKGNIWQEAFGRKVPFPLVQEDIVVSFALRVGEGGRCFLFIGLNISLGQSSCLLNASLLLTVCSVSDPVLNRCFMSVFLYNLNPVSEMVAFLWGKQGNQGTRAWSSLPKQFSY